MIGETHRVGELCIGYCPRLQTLNERPEGFIGYVNCEESNLRFSKLETG